MEYRVLARKYRPSSFDDLIGQEVLVRTLSNAIASGRIAHAFLLTGIRGVGKTTTARIIARALNCIGEDGKGGPTVKPCGVCENCRMIAEDRHVDVLEMDAASHTGVDDIRSIIDTVRYLPASARYKVYIIDEVHMLSGSAFNALLKTLEEPPPHVKFVFATTESRKIPVTVLSRCQRFDLKRISLEQLARHLGGIAAKENIAIEPPALHLIATVAEGSVRDALSLLDQAGAHGEAGRMITAADIRRMIGSGDSTATFAMLDTLLRGDIAATLEAMRTRYAAGADPLWMVQDAMEAVHLVTRAKIAPDALQDVTLSPHDSEAAGRFAGALSMPVLARLWQMLLKGLSEVRAAPQPVAALEMLLVRIAYTASLPTPAEVIGTVPPPAGGKLGGGHRGHDLSANAPLLASPLQGEGVSNFFEVVALFEAKREALLHTQLKHEARLVSFAPGRIKLSMPNASRDFTSRVSSLLETWTGKKWQVVLSEETGAATLGEQANQKREQRLRDTSQDPLVAQALAQFPGAKLVEISKEENV